MRHRPRWTPRRLWWRSRITSWCLQLLGPDGAERIPSAAIRTEINEAKFFLAGAGLTDRSGPLRQRRG